MPLHIRALHARDIPIVELVRGADATAFDTLSRSLDELGFLAVSGHGVDLDLLDRCYDVSRAFFAQPLAEKSKVAFSETPQGAYGNTGYFPMRSERAAGASLADAKEFFHVGQPLNGERLPAGYSSTPWPSCPGFRVHFETLFEQFRACGDRIFHLIARWAGLPREYASSLVEAGNHVLRTIHYPPVSDPGLVTWAAAHTGIQLLGLQPRTSHPALQIALPSGEWVRPGEGYGDLLIINIGEMLSYLLDERARPTLHRVVTHNGEHGSGFDRYAIVFFYHANAHQRLHRLGSAPAKSEAMQVGTWLHRRLKTLGILPPDASSPPPRDGQGAVSSP